MIAAMAIDPPARAAGLPLGLAVREAIRVARRAPKATQAPAPTVVAAPAGAAPLPEAVAIPIVLACLLRGHRLTEIRDEVAALAEATARERDHAACLMYGRTYGDPALKAAITAQGPDPALSRCHVQMAARADRLAALADLIGQLVGREAGIEGVLTGGAGV